MTPCRLVREYEFFGETYCLSLPSGLGIKWRKRKGTNCKDHGRNEKLRGNSEGDMQLNKYIPRK
jgi:hypothetical protein